MTNSSHSDPRPRTFSSCSVSLSPLWAKASLLSAAAASLCLMPRTAFADHSDGTVGRIIVIALENHNLTQPSSITDPQQILGNPAAPYINSLITPGNPNAAQVSYAVNYRNAGIGVHPSEPNYIWAEAGTNFNDFTDADPSLANGNLFSSVHLSGQLVSAGIHWKNYQEDVQLSTSPIVSASGTNGAVNAFNGSTQFNYAVKHNPMAFFADTWLENVFPLSQFFQDLSTGALGRYNWVTPDQYNEQHSSLNAGFTYQGIAYTGDQAAIAEGDNFLSKVVPQIMASDAYQDNGVLVLWWDESEGADDLTIAIPEIVISPLAKGNAFASTVELSHSSDIKTWEEVLGLPFVNNPILASETAASGTGFNNVATVNDLSDLFVPGAIPGARTFATSSGRIDVDPQTQHAFQDVRVTNTGTSSAPAPLFLVLDNLPTGVSLLNQNGATSVLAPLGSPFVTVKLGGDNVLQPHESKTVRLEFANPGGVAITYSTRVLTVTPQP